MPKEEGNYLVHTRNRPVRVAFLVDTSKPNAVSQVEHVIEYARKKWGGRFFPIIPAPGGKLNGVWLDYLVAYDPDLIHSKVVLEASTVKAISLRLNPSFLEVDTRSERISLGMGVVDVLPDAKNSAYLWRNPFQEYSILNIKLMGEQSRIRGYIKSFVNLNFGQLGADYSTDQLTAGRVLVKEVRGKASLLEAMKPLAEWHKRIYPNEYSHIPGIDREANTDDYTRDVATLFIGNSADDLIYFWNNALNSPYWLSHQMINAWAPTNFFDDEDLLTALKEWMSKFINKGNGSDPKTLRIRSSSIGLNTLRKYERLLKKELFILTDTKKITGPGPLKYDNHVTVTGDMETYSVSGKSVDISVKPIDQLEGSMGGQYWMTDFYIERDNPNHAIINPTTYWLLLPPYNSLAYRVVKQIGSRINYRGLPSTFTKRDDKMVSLVIPDDRDILGNLLLGGRTSIYHNGDPRDLGRGMLRGSFSNYRSSQSGRSLRGFIHLFGGFMEAVNFFENPYWRRVVLTMAGGDPAGDSAMNTALRNSLAKDLKKAAQSPPQKSVEALVGRVQAYSRQLKIEGKEKGFGFFEKEFLEEIKEYNRINKKSTKYSKNNEAGLKSSLDHLIGIDLIQIGVKHRCQLCGLNSFYEIETVKTHMQCVGCSYEFTILTEQKWSYRLNTIAGVNGAIYSQIPLILALGALYEQSRYSFYFHPPVDVFVGAREKHLTDLDLFVILDGKLVIGEVKNSQSLFTDGDIEKLAKAAELLRPAKVVLSSLDETLTPASQNKVSALQKRLGSVGIEVEWLKLDPGVFDIDPRGV